MVNIMKNPRKKERVSPNLLRIIECPITSGIKGNTQGDATETKPAKNEKRNDISI